MGNAFTSRWNMRLRCGFLVLSLMASGTGAVAADVLVEARALLTQGRAGEALALLLPFEGQRAGEPAFDFLLGVAALEAGETQQAVFALERTLDLQPDNDEARAFLGRAYFELGEDDTARAAFGDLRDHGLPAAVAESVDHYLSAIDQRTDAMRTRWDAWFESGIGWDSNVSNATDASRIAVPAIGGVLILASGSREQSSLLWTTTGGAAFSTPIAADWTLFGNASLSHRQAMAASEFSQFTAGASLGTAWRAGEADVLRLSASAQRFDVGGARNRDLGGATLEWQHRLGQATELLTWGQYARLEFPLQPLRDVDRWVGGLGAGHAIGGRGSPVVYGSVYGATEQPHEDNADFVGREQVGLRLGGEYTLDSRTVCFLSFDYAKSLFHADEPLFLETRSEDFYAVALGARHPLGKHLSLRPQVGWSSNRSNIELFQYNRWETMLTLRSDF